MQNHKLPLRHLHTHTILVLFTLFFRSGHWIKWSLQWIQRVIGGRLDPIASSLQLWHHWDDWDLTGIIRPQDWHYRPAHLCWEWDPFYDLHQIFIAPGQKVSVCWMWESVDVNSWVHSNRGAFRKAVKGFWVCMNVCVGPGVPFKCWICPLHSNAFISVNTSELEANRQTQILF